MKTDQYKIDYYWESLSCIFDEVGLYEIWNSIPREKQNEIADGIIGTVENQSMAFGYVDTKGCDSYEVSQLKNKLAIAEIEAKEWQKAFETNVSRRRGWPIHEVWISKDGEAGNILMR